MPGEWNFQNQMQFTQSSPIDLGGSQDLESPQFGIHAPAAPPNPPAFSRQLLGAKRNSVSAGLGGLGGDGLQQVCTATIPGDNNNILAVSKRLCLGFDPCHFQGATATGAVQHSPNGFPTSLPPGIIPGNFGENRMEESSAGENLGNPGQNLRNIPAHSGAGVFNFLPTPPTGVMEPSGMVQADRTYRDSYVEFFGPYVKQYGRESPDIEDTGTMKEGSERMDEDMPSTPPPATHQSPPRATHSPETCRQYLRSGSYSPRQVFSYCQPNGCALYPYHSDIY